MKALAGGGVRLCPIVGNMVPAVGVGAFVPAPLAEGGPFVRDVPVGESKPFPAVGRPVEGVNGTGVGRRVGSTGDGVGGVVAICCCCTP